MSDVIQFKPKVAPAPYTPPSWTVVFLRPLDGGIIVELDEKDFNTFTRIEMVENLRLLATAIEAGLEPK